jgi:hypothetical protein
MAAIATIAIDDGQATPVSHDFDPANVQDGIAKYEDRVDGIAVGYPSITVSVRRPTKGSRAYKVMIKVAVPTLEQASSGGTFVPPPTNAYDNLAVMEFMLPERSSLDERKDILAYAKNLLAHAVVESAVHDLESVY